MYVVTPMVPAVGAGPAEGLSTGHGAGGVIPARRHCGRVSRSSLLCWVNARRHMARAPSPQACSTAPPVLLGSTTVTHPLADRP